MKSISDAVKSDILILDGSMGALLQQMGVSDVCPDMVGVNQPEVIQGIHRSYHEAGANIVIADTFGTTPAKLKRLGLDARTEEIARIAVENAKLACPYAYVALDVGPTGELLMPLGTLSLEDAIKGYEREMNAGSKADFAILETMSDLAEARSAMLAAKNCGMPFAVSFTFGANGRTMTGGTPECAAILAEKLGAIAIGANCSGGPEQMKAVIEKMCAVTSLPVMAQPNAGLPILKDGVTTYPCNPDTFCTLMKDILEAGATMVGGCCGTTPDHIRKLAAEAKKLQYSAHKGLQEAVVCSQRNYAVLSEALEERVNVTTDLDEIYDGEDASIYMIDLTGAEPEDAIEAIEEAITETSIPLGFIADNEETLAAALLSYPGIAAVETAFDSSDICLKYGAVRL